MSSRSTLGAFVPKFVFLSSGILVFTASQGSDFAHSFNYLVAVDLSKGLAHPVSHKVDIPKDRLKRPGENPNFVQITKIEENSPDSVRLHVIEPEYGVESIVAGVTPGSMQDSTQRHSHN